MWEKIKDPNIDIVTSSPVYYPTNPTKRWIDRRALDPNNQDEGFSYRKLVFDDKGVAQFRTFVLTREAAAVANVPSVEQAAVENTSTWKPGDVPVPVRELAPGEYVTGNPFGGVTLHRAGESSTGSVDLSEVLRLLREIRERV